MDQPGRTRERRPGRPRKTGSAEPPISRDVVIRCAYGLCDRVRLDDISLDMLARQIGVTTTTIRHHIKTRAALTAALINLYFEELVQRLPPPTGQWRIDLDNFLWAYFGLNIRKIGFASFLFEHRFAPELDPLRHGPVKVVHARLLKTLQEAGLNTMDAALAWHLVFHLVLSIAYAEARGQTPANQPDMFDAGASADAGDGPDRAVLAALRYVNLPMIFGLVSNMIQNAIARKFDFPDVSRPDPSQPQASAGGKPRSTRAERPKTRSA